MSKAQLNMGRISRGLGAIRVGKVKVAGGYFGAVGLADEVRRRFRTPKRGGRQTDPAWTEKRLLGLAPRTLKRLREITERLSADNEVTLAPMQLASLMLERALELLDEAGVKGLVRTLK